MVYPYVTFVDVLIETYPMTLAERGHNIVIVTSKNEELEKYSQKNLSFRTLNDLSISIPQLIISFPYLISLEETIKQLEPDIVHINNLPFLTTLQSTRVAKRLGITSIVHVHGVIAKINRVLNATQYLYIRTLGRSIFRDASSLICLTNQDAREIHKCGCQLKKIRIIPNGVDIKKFRPLREGRDNWILWGGRFVPQKGLEYLIKALHFVIEKNSEVKLVLTGDGPLFPKIQSMVKNLKLERNVLFKGRVPREKLPYIISTASIYVLPSLKEGMPFALLEAMSCGKAVIGSDIPGINDIITHEKNGILVPPRNSTALADAILMMLKNEELRKQLGKCARRLMVENYSWKKIGEKIERVYYDNLERARGVTFAF